MNSDNHFLSILEQYRAGFSSNNRPFSSLGILELQNLFIAFKKTNEPEWPNTVSYYCSLDVANSIIRGGNIWLNDVRKMNDRTEMTFAVEFIGDAISKIQKDNEFNPGLVSTIKESYIDLTNSSMWNDTIIYNEKLILAMCFSEAKDDAAMWDRYADSGSGISIHFNLKKLATSLVTAGHFFPNTSAFENGITRVCYGGENCNCVINLHHHALDAYTNADNNEERDLIRTMLYVKILELLVSHKHKSFSSEKEFRMFSKAPSTKTWSGSDHIHERENGKGKTLYHPIFLPHLAIGQSEDMFWNELISKVMVGPCASSETYESIKFALKTRGIVSKLSLSTCPLTK